MLRSADTEWHLTHPFLPKTLAPARALGADSADTSCEIPEDPGKASRTLVTHSAAALRNHREPAADDQIIVPARTKYSMGHIPPRSRDG
jgi:hypothetical protein